MQILPRIKSKKIFKTKVKYISKIKVWFMKRNWWSRKKTNTNRKRVKTKKERQKSIGEGPWQDNYKEGKEEKINIERKIDINLLFSN
jgi:hypothetical protein